MQILAVAHAAFIRKKTFERIYRNTADCSVYERHNGRNYTQVRKYAEDTHARWLYGYAPCVIGSICTSGKMRAGCGQEPWLQLYFMIAWIVSEYFAEHSSPRVSLRDALPTYVHQALYQASICENVSNFFFSLSLSRIRSYVISLCEIKKRCLCIWRIINRYARDRREPISPFLRSCVIPFFSVRSTVKCHWII